MSSARGRVVSAQQRFRARRRRGPRYLPPLIAVGVLAALAGLAWLLTASSLFALRTVTVEGNSRLGVDQVVAAADVRSGQSLLRVDPDAVGRRVARLAPVASVEVSRRWPHGLVIHLTERRPAAVLEAPGETLLVDRTGVPFASAPTPPPDLVHVQVDGAVQLGESGAEGNAAARAAMQVLDVLPPRIRRHVTSVQAPSTIGVRLELTGDRTVLWGGTADARTKASVLQTLLHRPAHVYDVSTPPVVATR